MVEVWLVIGDLKDMEDISSLFSLATNASSCVQDIETLFNLSTSKNGISQRVVQTTFGS